MAETKLLSKRRGGVVADVPTVKSGYVTLSGPAVATLVTPTAKSIDELLSGFEKKFGAGSMTKLGNKKGMKVEVIPTGIYTLDTKALGVGGVPRGRIIEVFGPESSGKTTITLQIIASAQKAGGKAAFVDAEHALNPAWATKMGVDVDELLISQPDNGEQALEMAIDLVESGLLSVVVIDSVSALVPKAELDGEMGDSHVGLQARLMSQAMRKLTGAVSKTKTIVIFINQIREKIGVMFGSPETTSGGRALKFFASVRIDVRRIGQEKDGEQVVGNRTKLKIVKNKVAAPFRETEVVLRFDSGFDRVGNLVEAAVAANVIDKAGAWYSYSGERIGQGAARVRDFLMENTTMFDEIYAKTVAANAAPVEKVSA